MPCFAVFSPGTPPFVLPLLVACAVVIFCVPAFCMTLWVLASGYRRRSELEFSRLRQLVESTRTGCAEEIATLARSLEAIGTSRQTMEDLLQGGRLSQSRRSQALRLLRSGMAPDTAAATLGMATREMRLLAGVSPLLTPPPGTGLNGTGLNSTEQAADPLRRN